MSRPAPRFPTADLRRAVFELDELGPRTLIEHRAYAVATLGPKTGFGARYAYQYTPTDDAAERYLDCCRADVIDPPTACYVIPVAMVDRLFAERDAR